MRKAMYVLVITNMKTIVINILYLTIILISSIVGYPEYVLKFGNTDGSILFAAVVFALGITLYIPFKTAMEQIQSR